MGDEVSKRTKQALLAGIERVQRLSTKALKKKRKKMIFWRASLVSLLALAQNKIECRIYDKDKFHAKAYITHGKLPVVGSFALVGSSNFTMPGLTENVDLNVQIRTEVEALRAWYEKHWDEANQTAAVRMFLCLF
jgi:PLD-like domain